MMTIETVVVAVAGLSRAEVEAWVTHDLVRPVVQDGTWMFRDIDIARLRLIQELRHELRLDEDALPVVLRLMDQLYDARRRLRRLCDAVERAAPSEARAAVLTALLER